MRLSPHRRCYPPSTPMRRGSSRGQGQLRKRFKAGDSIMRFLPVWHLARAVALALTFTTASALVYVPARAQDGPARILYFTHAAGYRHEVIPVSREILKQVGETSPRFEVATTEDVSVFTP